MVHTRVDPTPACPHILAVGDSGQSLRSAGQGSIHFVQLTYMLVDSIIELFYFLCGEDFSQNQIAVEVEQIFFIFVHDKAPGVDSVLCGFRRMPILSLCKYGKAQDMSSWIFDGDPDEATAGSRHNGS